MSLFCDRVPSATKMLATVFSTSKATVETFPAGSKWVLQRLAELASINGPSNRLRLLKRGARHAASRHR
jgi:hypothetical protein